MHYLGIDYGGTTIKVGLFNDNLELLNEMFFKSKDANHVAIVDSIKSMISEEVIIGLSIASFVDKDSNIVGTTNLSEDYLGFIDLLYKNVSSNISVINDADAALKCELYELNNTKRNICMIVLGTGVGGAIALDNKLIQGNRGVSCEIGHLKVSESYGFKCGCGRSNCLESIVSVQGFINLYEYYKDDYPNSILNEIKDISLNDIFDHRDDVLARYIIDKALYYLAQACIQVALICDIELFIIGGGISMLLEDDIKTIKSIFKDNSHYLQQETDFQIALNRNRAGIMGAVLYAKEEQVK